MYVSRDTSSSWAVRCQRHIWGEKDEGAVDELVCGAPTSAALRTMRAFALALAALLFAPSAADPYPAGVEASISASAVNYLVAQLLPFLSKKIGTISIPDINGGQDGFDYSLSAIQCNSFTFGSGVVGLTPPATLALTLSGIGVSCSANWHFALHSWPHFPSGSGNLDASVSSTSAALSVVMSESNLRPVLACPGATLSIGNIDISFHGDSALDWLLDLFKSLIDNAVKGSLDKAFGPIVQSFVNEDGNAFLATIPIAVPINARAPYNISEARFGFVQAPSINPTCMGIAVQGDVVPKNFTGVPPVPAPATPPFNSSDGLYMVEGRFSAYTLQSAAWTYASARLLQWALPSTALPLGLNSTAAYGLIAPGLAKAYPGAAVSLNLSVGEASPIAIAINPTPAGGILALAVLQLDFVVQGGAAAPQPLVAFSILANTSFSLAVSIVPDPLHPGSLVFSGDLAYLKSALAVGNSTVGPVSVGLLQGLVDITLVRFCAQRHASAPPTLALTQHTMHHLLSPTAASHCSKREWGSGQGLSNARHSRPGLHQCYSPTAGAGLCCVHGRLFLCPIPGPSAAVLSQAEPAKYCRLHVMVYRNLALASAMLQRLLCQCAQCASRALECVGSAWKPRSHCLSRQLASVPVAADEFDVQGTSSAGRIRDSQRNMASHHPRSIPCPSCGGLYFAASLAIHQRTCEDKAARTKHECPFCRGFIPVFDLAYHVEHCAARPLRDNTRVFTPLPPLRVHARPLPLPGSAGGAASASASASSPPYGAARGPCCVCGRVFALERLQVHENACRNINRPRAVFHSAAQRAATCHMDAGGLAGSSGPGDGTFGAPPPLPPRRSRGRSAAPAHRPSTATPRRPPTAPLALASPASPAGGAAGSAHRAPAHRAPRSASSPPTGSSSDDRELRRSDRKTGWRAAHEGFQRMLAQARRQKRAPRQQQQQQPPQQPPQRPASALLSRRAAPTASASAPRPAYTAPRPASAAHAYQPLARGGGATPSSFAPPSPASRAAQGSSSSSSPRRSSFQLQVQQIMQAQDLLQRQLATVTTSGGGGGGAPLSGRSSVSSGSHRGGGAGAPPPRPATASAASRLHPPSPVLTRSAEAGKYTGRS